MNKVKNLGYVRWWTLKVNNLAKNQVAAVFSFARHFQKCVTQFYRALYGDAIFVSF